MFNAIGILGVTEQSVAGVCYISNVGILAIYRINGVVVAKRRSMAQPYVMQFEAAKMTKSVYLFTPGDVNSIGLIVRTHQDYFGLYLNL